MGPGGGGGGAWEGQGQGLGDRGRGWVSGFRGWGLGPEVHHAVGAGGLGPEGQGARGQGAGGQGSPHGWDPPQRPGGWGLGVQEARGQRTPIHWGPTLRGKGGMGIWRQGGWGARGQGTGAQGARGPGHTTWRAPAAPVDPGAWSGVQAETGKLQLQTSKRVEMRPLCLCSAKKGEKFVSAVVNQEPWIHTVGRLSTQGQGHMIRGLLALCN